MGSSDYISLAALVVSILALPTSYFVSKQQVRIGLDENEIRIRRRTRLLVADRLDELLSLFISEARILTGVDLTQKKYEIEKLSRHIIQIDEAVRKTGILERLGKSIDDYTEAGDPSILVDQDVKVKLQMIRSHIHRGSNSSGIFPTWEICTLAEGNNLSSMLRKE